MDITFLKKLEFEKIINNLSSFCETNVGKDFALSLFPSFSFEEVNYRLNETDQAFFVYRNLDDEPHFFTFYIDMYIKKIESSNYLSCKELLNIARLLENARLLKNIFFNNVNFDASMLDILEKLFSDLYSNLNIEKEIFSKIIDENTLDDKASSNLYSIRTEKKAIEAKIKDTLSNFIHSSSKYLQEQVITIRNNRYVVPVKEEYKNFVKGFVHDVSSTGSTLFIEPLSIFEINNELSSLEIKEKKEIEKILSNLSSLFLPIINEIKQTSINIGKLDFIFAKVKFALSIHATKPILTKEKNFTLIKARHPLIDSKKIVPIDINIGKSFRSLVITGPNTGGKTVTLKTCGLLLSMAYSGLFIPADEKTTICVFDFIFIDIGDEQSIDASLSTFSAHMTNIVSILKQATENSFILIDELRFWY